MSDFDRILAEAADLAHATLKRESDRRLARARQWTSRRLATYGLTKDGFDTLLRAQGGRCAICRDSFDVVECHVDHDHATGRVRSLLCRRCNAGLGMFREKIERLAAAIEYLKFHKESE